MIGHDAYGRKDGISRLARTPYLEAAATLILFGEQRPQSSCWHGQAAVQTFAEGFGGGGWELVSGAKCRSAASVYSGF